MLETPHVAVGVAIAVTFPNPFIAIPLSLLSHVALDKVPHWNPHTFTETEKHGRPTNQTFAITIADIAVAAGLGFFVAYQALPDYSLAILIILCSLASVLPDVVKYPYFLFKRCRKGWLHKWVLYERTLQVDTTIVPGLLTQLFTLLIALWWIVRFNSF